VSGENQTSSRSGRSRYDTGELRGDVLALLRRTTATVAVVPLRNEYVTGVSRR
jgi:hypothetical protein